MKSHPAWVCGLKPAKFATVTGSLCHTLRGCVDWNRLGTDVVGFRRVTPCVGVWIETFQEYHIHFYIIVTPCVGVWIETFLIMIRLKSLMSHPAWVCGLKPQLVTTRPRKDVSHPAWVCGLKHPFRELLNGCNSHTLRGCVDWNPFKTTSPIAISCHTLRGCVDWNNREIAIRCDRRRVTPCVGVWIETNVQAAPVGPLIVTPCVGVWIETSNSVQTGWPISSHPAWVYMDWSIVHSLVKFMEEL